MAERIHSKIGSKLRAPTVLATSVILSAVSLAKPAAAQEAGALPAGIYTLQMRDSAAFNPFATSFITIADGGQLLWERDGQPFAMMQLKQRGDTLNVEDVDGCPLSPVGTYLVEHRPGGGYQLKLLADGCGDRSISIARTYLRPLGR